jgi:outer membrane protein OmpA-like peptidoglycan-associated protein
MNFSCGFSLGITAILLAGAVQAAESGPPYKDCPLTGVMPDYQAEQNLDLRNYDALTFQITENGETKEIAPRGSVCIQSYAEKQGKTEGSALEIMMNYKEALLQQGAEIKEDHDGYLVGKLTKDGKEIWINVSASRDDGYTVRELVVEPFKRTLLPPGGNDYRLLGHMPGFTADTPTKKNYDEYSFPIEGGSVAIRGTFYRVGYQPPAKAPAKAITSLEIVTNYQAALGDLHAEFLREYPDHETPENITARLEDQGKTIYVFVDSGSVLAVEEKPFQLTIQPPTADAMKDKLDKEGHIALYVNFDFAKATLKPDAQPIIAQVVELLKRSPDLKLTIDGHTDSIGGHDYNIKLSQDRAAAVAAAITASGIESSRLSSAGYGPDKPIAPNDTDDGRAKNRRVELVKAS